MRRRRSRVLSVLTAGLLPIAAAASVQAGGQLVPGEIERDLIRSELREYALLVSDYRGGSDEAVSRLSLLDRRSIDRVIAGIETSNDEMRPWDDGRFKAGVMMHTDFALRLLDRSDPDSAVLHIDTATRLLSKGGPELRAFGARWYHALAAWLRARNQLTLAEQFLETGRERLPGDPTVLYESGTLQELLATDTVLPTGTGRRAPDALVMLTPFPSSVFGTTKYKNDLLRQRKDRLDRAAAWLQESLAREPSGMSARVHLGRVETLRKESDEGLRLLATAAASPDVSTAYLALLFTGAGHERQGRLDAAASAYRAATVRMPSGHAAYMALSAVLHRSGRGQESREALRRLVNATGVARRDPWWTYLREHPSMAVARLNLLRREARQ